MPLQAQSAVTARAQALECDVGSPRVVARAHGGIAEDPVADAAGVASGPTATAPCRSRDDARTPDITLQGGLSARGDGGTAPAAALLHGPFGEQMLIPTENGDPRSARSTPRTPDAGCGARTAPGAVRRLPRGGVGGRRDGPTSAAQRVARAARAVHVALAMGAGCVVAPGRNEKVLEDLVRRFGPRVRPVRLTGDEDEDGERMRRAAPGPIDCVLDLLPPGAGPTPVRTAAMTVREFGRVVLMGGVGMQGGEDLHLPYPWLMRNSITVRGRWMYPAEAVARLIALVRCRPAWDLSRVRRCGIRALDEANEAVAHAAAEGGAFRTTGAPARSAGDHLPLTGGVAAGAQGIGAWPARSSPVHGPFHAGLLVVLR